jgi:hypothetical protein
MELGFVFAAATLGIGSLNLRIDSQTVFIVFVRAAGFEDIPFVLLHSPSRSQDSSEHAASRSHAEPVLLGELKPPLFKTLTGAVARQPKRLACRERRDGGPGLSKFSTSAS